MSVLPDHCEALREAGDRAMLSVASAGLNGTPHVGTVVQTFAVKRLDEAGFDTEFLLADDEKHAGGGTRDAAVGEYADFFAGCPRAWPAQGNGQPTGAARR